MASQYDSPPVSGLTVLRDFYYEIIDGAPVLAAVVVGRISISESRRENSAGSERP